MSASFPFGGGRGGGAGAGVGASGEVSRSFFFGSAVKFAVRFFVGMGAARKVSIDEIILRTENCMFVFYKRINSIVFIVLNSILLF
jgi:hypothetical protein